MSLSLLQQLARESNAEVLIINEPPLPPQTPPLDLVGMLALTEALRPSSFPTIPRSWSGLYLGKDGFLCNMQLLF